MKMLLDECIPKRLKAKFGTIEVYTVSEMGWSGVKNGNLMKLCVANQFDILLTIDKNMVHQQNLDRYNITIAVLNSHTSKIEELSLFIPSFLQQLPDFQKHQAYYIEK